MRAQQKVILVVAAHPDDEVLGCGGTIAVHSGQGQEVHLLIMTEGITSRYYDPDQLVPRDKELAMRRAEIEKRKEEALGAAVVLGVNPEHVYFQDLADQRLDQYPLLNLIKRIERVRDAINPQCVYTHFWGDLNLDHQLTCRAVLTAFRPQGGQAGIPVYHFEIPETTTLSTLGDGPSFNPNHFIDITKTKALKDEALTAYASEKRDYPDLRSMALITELAKQRARGKGYAYAEAFLTRKV